MSRYPCLLALALLQYCCAAPAGSDSVESSTPLINAALPVESSTPLINAAQPVEWSTPLINAAQPVDSTPVVVPGAGNSSPADNIDSPAPPPDSSTVQPAIPECQNTTDVYDSSQNGTENYRINVKGFTFLVAPSDTILGAAMLMMGDKPKPDDAPALRTRPVESTSRLLQLLTRLNGVGEESRAN